MTDRHDRQSLRWPLFDYTSSSAYFITIVTEKRTCVFGEINEDEVWLSVYGNIVLDVWEAIPDHFNGIFLDEFVIMPNRLHGIIMINDHADVGARHASPTINDSDASPSGGIQPRSLGAIVGSFKSASTRLINRVRETPGQPVWQRNYYDRVIRNGRELNAIREYIENNPLKWAFDKENPDR